MRLALLALAPLLVGSAQAQDPAMEQIDAIAETCAAMLEQSPDEWLGWRRSNAAGYASHFEFHEGVEASVLVEKWLIDAMASEVDTSCYRADGTLASLHSTMTSPNMANESGPAISREGRLYFAPDGTLLHILTRITENGEEVAPMDNGSYRLARECGLTAPHPTTDDVRKRLISELGDIEGNRPHYVPPPLDWCALAPR